MIKKLSKGFTLIEIVVVVVILGILSTITVVGYESFSVKARDTVVRDTAVKLAEAIELMSTQKNGGKMINGGKNSTQVATSAGCSDGHEGFQGYRAGDYKESYVCTLGDAVVAAGYMSPNDFAKVPVNKSYENQSVFDFYVKHCNDEHYYFFYTLEKPSSVDTQKFNELISASTCNGADSLLRDQYGMRAYIKLDVL